MQPFEIRLNGLAVGTTEFHWHIDGSFFAAFDNEDVLGADLNVDAEVDNSEGEISATGTIKGTVSVSCDRCLAEVALPVDTDFEQSEEFGEHPVFDLGQTVYDYVLTSLPLCRVHPEGECDPETVKYLSK